MEKKSQLEQVIEKVKKDPLDKLRKEFEQEQSKPVTRVVKLKYYSECGCGSGDWWYIKRVVPVDSSLQDGDEITILEKGDSEW